jgi:hypothetical protein
VGLLITGLVFLGVGLACLLWPERIQQYSSAHPGPRFLERYERFMRAPGYVTYLRVLGAGAVCVGCLLLGVLALAPGPRP